MLALQLTKKMMVRQGVLFNLEQTLMQLYFYICFCWYSSKLISDSCHLASILQLLNFHILQY